MPEKIRLNSYRTSCFVVICNWAVVIQNEFGMIGIALLIVSSVFSYFETYPQESCEAMNFADEHKKEIKKLKKYLPAQEARIAMCIVAPEVSQYSAIFDMAETYVLNTLYVHRHLSDFSIGKFQMKPSFATSIETEVSKYKYLSKYKNLIIKETTEKESRYKRIERLSSIKWQLVYLAAFIDIAKQRTRNMSFNSVEEKLKYWATLYNTGFDTHENRVYYYYNIDGFPKFTSRCFNYGDVCLEFYHNKYYCSFLK